MVSHFGNFWHPGYVGWQCEEWLLIDITWLAEAATVVTVILAKTVILSELLPSFVGFFFFLWINMRRINTRNYRIMGSCTGTILLRWHRHGGMAYTTRVMQRRNTGFLGRTCGKDKAMESPFIWESSWNAWSFAWAWMMSWKLMGID